MTTRGWNVLSRGKIAALIILCVSAGFLLGRCTPGTDTPDGPTEGPVEVSP